MRFQQFVNNDGNVFGGWVQDFEFGTVFVEVAVIEAFHNLQLNEIAQHFHIEHIAGIRVYFAHQFYFHIVIVPVIIGVITFAKDPVVFFVVPCWIVEPVCGVEIFPAVYCYFFQIKFLIVSGVYIYSAAVRVYNR